VVGIADSVQGEQVVAVITMTSDDEQKDQMVTVASVDSFLAERLAHYKRPKQYHVVDVIPRNHLGKVIKKTLLQDLQLLPP
jgi:acyl-CoA synthetase (AMP-forming)/AMP-acid ligase II